MCGAVLFSLVLLLMLFTSVEKQWQRDTTNFNTEFSNDGFVMVSRINDKQSNLFSYKTKL